VVARRDGLVEFLNLNTGEIVRQLVCPDKKGKFVGLSCPSSGSKGVFVCTADDGKLLHWSSESENSEASAPEVTVQLAKPISAAKLEPRELRLAYGGKENELKLWDIDAKKVAWSAKNVRL